MNLLLRLTLIQYLSLLRSELQSETEITTLEIDLDAIIAGFHTLRNRKY